MPAYVYMLRCADGSLYTGWTNDMKKRLSSHNCGRKADRAQNIPAAAAR